VISKDLLHHNIVMDLPIRREGDLLNWAGLTFFFRENVLFAARKDFSRISRL
jgi:hypothetical protein